VNPSTKEGKKAKSKEEMDGWCCGVLCPLFSCSRFEGKRNSLKSDFSTALSTEIMQVPSSPDLYHTILIYWYQVPGRALSFT
jgi:hypothetical protein